MADVQARIRTLLHEETILLGHSLENDLHALRLLHERVIDTALLYPAGQEGRKNSLRWLAQRYLSLNIQDGKHDSVQDACAALRLVKLKVSKGRSFAVQEEATENLFLHLEKQDPPRKSILVDVPHLARRFTMKTAAHAAVAESDEEVNHSISFDFT